MPMVLSGRLLVTVGPGFAESDPLLAKKNG